MEGLVGLRDRTALVTGHTGFKGGWLALWLAQLGVTVHGYALDPPTQPNLFEVANVAGTLASDTRADIRDVETLRATVALVQPDVVFHMAAQPLVREGYRDPIGTVASNVVGTAALLDAVRDVDCVRAVVVVTTDKVYENSEGGRAFGEDDRLGGQDPYSGSKAAAELIVASFRSSFFGQGRHPARIASARAGNVIGGGDWASDRLVPDCLRAFESGGSVRLRLPDARRPFQHVLGPLSGYMILADRLLGDDGERFARAWNFGPDAAEVATVSDVADRLATLWGNGARIVHEADAKWTETETLRLDSRQAKVQLAWTTPWLLDRALEETVAWHRAWLRGENMKAVSEAQIRQYIAAAPA